ncbi:MAG: hypothetical protein JWM98_2830 [Thermoleophilia bacterium]|nr:hypothetical protein [Thermoleophilia bacterium]
MNWDEPEAVEVDEDEAVPPMCPACGEDVAVGDLSCHSCGEALDDPTRGICGFCGVATSERCGGCSALVCWECSDGARTGQDAAFAGTPWCVDCRAGAGA